MPTVAGSTQQEVFSNDLDDFVSSGVGPDQATMRVLSSEFVAFDYGGTMKGSEVLAVRMTCEPLGGENDNKPFDIEWAVGPKMTEVSIVNNGAFVVAAPGSSKVGFSPNSNWAHALKSLKAAGFATNLVNGPAGVGYFVGGEFTIKRVPQPKRDGIEEANTKGYPKTYYAFLKIDSLPGENKKRRSAAPKTAAAPEAAPAVNGAAGPATPTTPAIPAGSTDYTSLVAAALAANGGSLAVGDLAKAIFDTSKATIPNLSAKDRMDMAKSIATEDSIVELAMKNKWVYEGGVLLA